MTPHYRSLATDKVLNSVAQELPKDGAPDWIHLTPVGQFSGVDGRGPFVVGDASAVIAASLFGGRKLPIDENHSIDLHAPRGGSTPARGWIVAMEARADGLWGKVEWTAEGRQLIEGRAYGFISPVFVATKSKPNAITKVLRAALTNDPNLTTLKSLHNAGDGTLEEKLIGLLGLGADASEEDIVAAVEKLLTEKNSVDPERFAPIELLKAANDELQKVRSGVTRHTAERLVDAALEDGKIMPFMRDYAINLCSANRPLFEQFIGSTGPAMEGVFKTMLTPETIKGIERNLREKREGQAPDDITRNLGLSAEDVKTYGQENGR